MFFIDNWLLFTRSCFAISYFSTKLHKGYRELDMTSRLPQGDDGSSLLSQHPIVFCFTPSHVNKILTIQHILFNETFYLQYILTLLFLLYYLFHLLQFSMIPIYISEFYIAVCIPYRVLYIL